MGSPPPTRFYLVGQLTTFDQVLATSRVQLQFLVCLYALKPTAFIVWANLQKFSKGGKKGGKTVNSPKCAPILGGSKSCGERERKRRGVTLGGRVKHLWCAQEREERRIIRSEWGICGTYTQVCGSLTTMIRCPHTTGGQLGMMAMF